VCHSLHGYFKGVSFATVVDLRKIVPKSAVSVRVSLPFELLPRVNLFSILCDEGGCAYLNFAQVLRHFR
jgi:hypothetical protein